MLLVADVHGAADALARVAASGEPVLVLGDLVNLIDYRTSTGIVAEVVGIDVVQKISALRASGRHAEASEMWETVADGRSHAVTSAIADLMASEYRAVCGALSQAEAFVIYGNVDRPDMLQSFLPPTAHYVDGETREIEGRIVGFAGGGIPRIGMAGEVAPDVMREKLERLGPVDILCTHVPPDVHVLASDVIGRTTKGSVEILEYLVEHEPAFHYFGDIHQPRATTWQVGRTTCVNVGYFRATGRAVRHPSR